MAMTTDEQIAHSLHNIEAELRAIRTSAGVSRPLRAVMWGTIWAWFWMGLVTAALFWRPTFAAYTAPATEIRFRAE